MIKLILILMLASIASYAELTKRINNSVITKAKDVTAIKVKPNNVTVIHFPSAVIEWYLGDNNSFVISSSQKTNGNLAIQTKIGNSIPRTNLIVKTKTQYFFLELVPSLVDFQDFVEISGISYGNSEKKSNEEYIKKSILFEKSMDGVTLKLNKAITRYDNSYLLQFEIFSSNDFELKKVQTEKNNEVVPLSILTKDKIKFDIETQKNSFETVVLNFTNKTVKFDVKEIHNAL